MGDMYWLTVEQADDLFWLDPDDLFEAIEREELDYKIRELKDGRQEYLLLFHQLRSKYPARRKPIIRESDLRAVAASVGASAIFGLGTKGLLAAIDEVRKSAIPEKSYRTIRIHEYLGRHHTLVGRSLVDELLASRVEKDGRLHRFLDTSVDLSFDEAFSSDFDADLWIFPDPKRGTLTQILDDGRKFSRRHSGLLVFVSMGFEADIARKADFSLILFSDGFCLTTKKAMMEHLTLEEAVHLIVRTFEGDNVSWDSGYP